MGPIQVKRGLAANLPTSGMNPGEFLFATDTGDLYICQSATVKILLAKDSTHKNQGWFKSFRNFLNKFLTTFK
ncbi:MAG: hypothetical protein KGZ81_09735 [Flavobacteriales bacterium]|nr:hypothetical protein [Flavobacteriales bacterium]